MPRALQHEYPRWESAAERGEEGGGDDVRYVWVGRMRIVHGQRARKLRKRGVPLLPLHRVLDRSGGEHRPGQFEPCSGDRARYAWFEPEAAHESRKRKRALTCYLVATRPEPFGRKQWLAARLASHRAHARERIAWRGLAKALTGRYTITYEQPRWERLGLYRGLIHENVLGAAARLPASVLLGYDE